ncbi:NAD-glutamate dehydrogenase domain-containing protein [Sphingosinicella sp. BN140058]|uniref:NAD-glutamate dehydrogenase n=1 Tax=Sphingosinicella sp. BN140058 TaxID=1892855 RepID=UPI0010131E2B|nr:NAD-glutamate dehydrogenase domain-containing protein [Sphingosinicella sp. BN140058]QAY77417.1 glutamate dehydrogenase [Sphingosinicella sp. BN140058]
MNSESNVADHAADVRILEALSHALVEGALPGEIAEFTSEDREGAARFIASCASSRMRGSALVRLESLGGAVGQRRMRIGIINDDMPFLVDSVANTIAARGLIVHRLLHPVVCVRRDEDGRLLAVEPLCDDKDRRESMMYLEVDRADARIRRDVVADLNRVLADVRAAVEDWRAMQDQMRADAAATGDEEGAALLRWFADGAMTLLGYEVERPDAPASQALGLFRMPGDPTDPGGSIGAIRYFEEGGSVPLLAKAERRSSVHRRVPLDLVVVPIREGDKVAAIGVHAGLWTSEALTAHVEDVPVLRQRLRELDEEFGFDPSGHSGKALRHALTALPHDLLASLSRDSVRELVTTAMSLADRPRPTLVLARSILKGNMFAFAWLPRDELTTRRRIAVGKMIEQASGGRISNWSVELGDGDLALLRYTLYVGPEAPTPDVAALDRQLDEMVRGWEPAVEEALGGIVGLNRATRLALSYMSDLPELYRAQTSPAEAAQDILRISELHDAGDRDARLYRSAGDGASRLRLKTYRLAGLIALSEAVPVFENFGFRVLEEFPWPLDEGRLGYIHEFVLELRGGGDASHVLARAELAERAIADVLEGRAENDSFNQLLIAADLDRRDVVLFRAWFRYLRQVGLSYSMLTVVEALRRAPAVTQALIALFDALHDPERDGDRTVAAKAAEDAIRDGLAGVAAIDEDRILRLFHGVIASMLRTNAFSPAGQEALAFKLESARVPGLPAPVPWREIWVYSPRVEGIHLRGGPIARGGLRWSDRRDDFRTEILGLMKAQLVKNAVIVPTGAKGGFYPKQLPPVASRDAWLAEGTESYRIFIRALLSVTDNIVESKVVHPDGVTIRDAEDPYFVVAADKGTATFSDIANQIALDRRFWLGDAFASGGSQGYDHKAMGITARGGWVSVQRHFAELGVDVQTQPIRVAGVGDMSGDVFGNGMLLSKALKVVAAFDHRHIFIDPEPDPAKSWDERARLFALPRSSWDDYDKSLISKGGGIFPRSQKTIPLSPEMQAMFGLDGDTIEPAALMIAILKAPVDLLWFGGIGTYIRARSESNSEVGDPANDAIRITGCDVRAKAIGEGANLGMTQAARIEFSQAGGRCNTDFIDNSAGVDCSDNEVNIKIPLNREMDEGRLSFEARNQLLAEMTDEVAAIVLEDNRLQTLALSIAERGGAADLPPLIRAMEVLEESGRLNRTVEGLQSNEELMRRAQDNRGLTRPELAVLLSTSKMALQTALEAGRITEDPTLEPELLAAFPKTMQARHRDAILGHRLRREIIATKIANRFVNRLGITAVFTLSEEEGASFGQVAAAFVAAERLFGMADLWRDLDTIDIPEQLRLELFDQASNALQLHIADILRNSSASAKLTELVETLQPGIDKLSESVGGLLRKEVAGDAALRRARLSDLGAPPEIADRLVRLFELNGGVGIAALGRRLGVDEITLTNAYTRLGEALGLDWAQGVANAFQASDQWERLLTAGLARDFEQLRLDFLQRARGDDPAHAVEMWVETQGPRIDQFRRLVDRARNAPATTSPMLAQIATQARVLLAR